MKKLSVLVLSAVAACFSVSSVLADADPLMDPSMTCPSVGDQNFCGTPGKNYSDGCFAKVAVAGCKVVSPFGPAACGWATIKNQLSEGAINTHCGYESNWLATHGHAGDISVVHPRCMKYEHSAIEQCHMA